MAGYLWFNASRVKPGIEAIDESDGYHAEFITFKHSLNRQSGLNERAALWSCVAALLQGLVFLIGLFC